MSTPSRPEAATREAPRAQAPAEPSPPLAKSGEGADSALAAMKRRMQAEALPEAQPDPAAPQH